jgi:hypothetical protein
VRELRLRKKTRRRYDSSDGKKTDPKKRRRAWREALRKNTDREEDREFYIAIFRPISKRRSQATGRVRKRVSHYAEVSIVK